MHINVHANIFMKLTPKNIHICIHTYKKHTYMCMHTNVYMHTCGRHTSTHI